MINEKFARLMYDIDKNLLPKDITMSSCDIFQNTLLELATGEIDCKQSLFGPVDEDKSFIKFLGLSAEDAELLNNFLKQQGVEFAPKVTDISDMPELQNEFNAIKEQLSADKFEMLINKAKELGKEYSYKISNDDIRNKLMPIFLTEIERVEQVCPEKLEDYKKASEKNEIVQELKFGKLAFPVLEEAMKLEDNCQDQYTKGALHVIFAGLAKLIAAEKINIETMKFAKMLGLSAQSQGGIGEFAGEVNFAYNQFAKLRKESEVLKNNEDAAKLKADFKAYRNFEGNVKKSNDASLAALSSLFGALQNGGMSMRGLGQQGPDNDQEDSIDLNSIPGFGM